MDGLYHLKLYNENARQSSSHPVHVNVLFPLYACHAHVGVTQAEGKEFDVVEKNKVLCQGRKETFRRNKVFDILERRVVVMRRLLEVAL
jgi:hypothetical protein